MSRSCSIAAVTFSMALLCLAPREARANGAFPESFQLILPADRASQIVLATNFGMMISDDAGATWTWTCEEKQTSMATLYAISAPPLDRFFALSSFVGLAFSDDQSCSWSTSGGSLTTPLVSDYFPDPTNPMRVLAIAAPQDSSSPPQVFPSADGGSTFTDAIYTAPAGATLTGVEIARSDPQTIYVAMATTGTHPMLVRSIDGGVHWTPFDLEPTAGANLFRIIAVDPADPMTITLRVIAAETESVVISHDGGQTFTKALTLSCGQLTAYAKLASGTILVAGAVIDQFVGFRSIDGGKTFTNWTPLTLGPNGTPLNPDAGAPSVASCDAGASAAEMPGVPHLRALSVRDGKLYGAAKNYSDDWAVGVSTDDGLTFAPVMKYSDVKSIRACAQQTCVDNCDYQASQFIWSQSICGPAKTVTPPPTKSGGGCQLGQRPSGVLGAVLLLAALAVARARRARR
ncbi:MAG TPA: hypothetical protein VH560_08340 [Polyangia bacterium]|jgi:hypothetical protein|nr:hypothetical protein [Polyangia bacterium]